MLRLQGVGLERFALFVSGWQPSEVRQLTALLEKLKASMADAVVRVHQPVRGARPRRDRTGPRGEVRPP